MSSPAARHASMMPLRELVARYRASAGEFGRPVALPAFQLPHAEIESVFSAFDEDYHISRFLKFSDRDGEKFSVNGVRVTHVSIDPEIETIL